MQLSTDQKFALDALLTWVDKPKGAFITLGGYAGTGKTTLIGLLRRMARKKDAKKKWAFVSFTGKASRVLGNSLLEQKAKFKGDYSGTIHSLIYSPIEDARTQEIIGWEKKDDLKADVIVVDEASMVTREIWQDLLSFKVPIIAVGDHGQLPPVGTKFNLMEKPILKLEEIHRQAKDNPIIQLSVEVRKSGTIPIQEYSKRVRKISRQDHETQEVVEDLLRGYNSDTMVLCGFNRTRVELNKFIRNLLEIESMEPTSGDRVICLRNNHKKQVFNGMVGTVNSIEGAGEINYLVEITFEDYDQFYKGEILKEQFNAQKPMNMGTDRKKTVASDLFDFGYALTVHKAQGSQAHRVILFEERFPQMDDEMFRRWLYTGVTRAQEELHVVG
ncbi:AAA family ATPase [Candidatus Dojkabacteria bacterium]|nr:AAA family ATPase [Candidatus Dojkabacteria bacterium]